MNGAADIDCAPAAGAITNAAAATAPAVPANVRAIRWITDMSRSPLEGPLCGTTEEARISHRLCRAHAPPFSRAAYAPGSDWNRVSHKWRVFGALSGLETRPATEVRGLSPSAD